MQPPTVQHVMPLPKSGVLAILPLAKATRDPFFAPDFVARSLWMLAKVCVTLGEVTVDGCLGMIDGWIIAVMDDRSGESAEHRFNDIEELCSRR